MKNLILMVLAVTCTDPSWAGGDSVHTIVQRSQTAPHQPSLLRLTAKDPSTATWMAVGHTVLPLLTGMILVNSVKEADHPVLFKIGGASMIYGATLGPSMGNFYARDFSRGGLGILGRAVGALLLTSGAGLALHDVSSGSAAKNNTAQLLVFSGLLVGGAGTFYNFVTVPTSVKEFNSKHSVTFSPAYDPLSKTAVLNLQLMF